MSKHVPDYLKTQIVEGGTPSEEILLALVEATEAQTEATERMAEQLEQIADMLSEGKARSGVGA